MKIRDDDYCSQIGKIDLASIADTLGVESDNGQLIIPLFGTEYRVSGNGMEDASGTRPNYSICVILSKYVLLCPDRIHQDTEWVSFKDFKKDSHFTNVNFFSSDTERVIVNHFSGRLDQLFRAGDLLGGFKHDADMPYDLSLQFDALPSVSLLLLFNDKDEEFPAQGTVLFQKHSEYYLDPESLIMTSAMLAKRLKKTASSL